MKVVVCGLAPLPDESAQQSPATGARTWQLARSLARDGHDVSILARRIPGAHGVDISGVRTRSADGLEVIDAPWEDFAGVRWLRRAGRELVPDLLVGACVHGAYDACRVESPVPLWADLFGDPMAEAQARALRLGHNRPLVRRWRMLEQVLRRADRFSTVSERQRLATLGELAAVGRLGLETAAEELVHFIPFAVEKPPPRSARAVARGRLVGDEAFLLLWSGSYNVWADVDTLFAGVDAAMDSDPRVQFLSTGGAVPGYDQRTYQRFVELVEGSARRDRFHLLGWIPRERAATLLYEADLGLVIEQRLLEGELGTKSRISEWIAAGLPVLASDVSELPARMAAAGAAFVVRPADPDALSRLIVELVQEPERLERAREAADAFRADRLSFGSSCSPLVEWARGPVVAGDRAPRAGRPKGTDRLRRRGSPTPPLSLWQRARVLAETLLRRFGLERWWLRRKLRSIEERER